MSNMRSLTVEQEEQRDAFVERLLESTAGVFDIFSVFLGHRLNWYRTLDEEGELTAAELAELTNTDARYAQEWLEQQTVVGVLEVIDPDADVSERKFALSPAHAEVLVDVDSPNYVPPLAQLAAGAVRPIEQLVEAYRTGDGVPYSGYGADFRQGQADINRVTFLQDLGNEWLPSIPDLHARLQNGSQARIADFGSGAGWSSIGMAQAYPKVQVDGFDLDGPSIEMARQNAKDAGINGRVQFHQRDASDAELAGKYDLVTAFEALHDMSDPVGALETMRRLAGEDGSVIVVDERVGDSFTANGNDVEWMMYGWSVLHCLPVGMAEHPSAATGTVMRTSTLERYAAEAGFSKVEVLPIENFFFRVYRLHV